jgi:hypothetical protein
MSNNYVNNLFMRTMIRKYEYERDNAIAHIKNLFDNPVVSDKTFTEPSVTDELDSWLHKLSDAENKLKSLLVHFAQKDEETKSE